MLLIGLPILMIGLCLYWNQKPQLGSISPEELKDSADYINRLSRKGVFTPAKFTPVIAIGSAQPKRILMLGPRKWEEIG